MRVACEPLAAVRLDCQPRRMGNGDDAKAGRAATAWRSLGFLAACAVLALLGIYFATPHPTDDQTTLLAVAAESQQLLATHSVSPPGDYLEIPKDKWPAAIASLRPVGVTVRRGMVDITTRDFFDGGWGYGFAQDKRLLGMLPQCWSALGHGVFWHGPC